MAHIEKRGEKWLVRWRQPDGTERARRCPTRKAADALKLAVETAVSCGKAWHPEVVVEVPALVELDEDDRLTGGLFADYMEARKPKLAAGTRRAYDRSLRRFATFVALRHPRAERVTVDLLTKDAVEGWFGSLVDPDSETSIGVSSARLAVTAVYSAWDWAYDSDTYKDAVSRPRRFDMPMPTTTPAIAPTWDQMDAVIAKAYHLALVAPEIHGMHREAWLWRARLCTLLRFTGLRVDEQVMRLQWSDFHLEAQELVIRGELGKSRRERAGRVIPLSPFLCDALAGWGKREGFVVAPHKISRTSQPARMAQLWELAKVPERVWGVSEGRSKASVHHAFRKGFKTGLSRLGVAQEVRDFLVGHHRGIDEHYLDTYAQARAAVALIPALSDDAAAGAAMLGAAVDNVVTLPSRGRT
jgi:integrase